jgi:phosphoesterase RecJ-like protein
VRWLGADSAPSNFFFLPHVKEYVTQKKYKFDSGDDLYVFIDSANEDRGIEGLREKSPDAVVLNIDHHADNTRFGTLNCVDSGASSTSEILWRIMTAADWPITQTIAECLYTGLTADTGWFAFNNTTSDTHLMAADLLNRGVNPSRIDSCARHNRSIEGTRLWGLALLRVFLWGESSQFAMTWLTLRDFAAVNAVPSDTSMLVNQMLMIQGVRFAVLLTESDDSGQVKGNLRSKEGVVEAASVARALGGGGHPRAAGIHLALPMADAIQVVQEAVDKAYAEWAFAGR